MGSAHKSADMALQAKGAKLRPSSAHKLRPAAKRADQELVTRAHREWAHEVKRIAGFRCEDCGAEGREIAGASSVALYADHIKERKDGGARYDPANGRCRCGPCHGRKTAEERAKRYGVT